MPDFVNWLNAVVRDGLSQTTHRFYSMYRAEVVDNRDPEGLGRIKIQCHTVGHMAAPNVWVKPAFAGAGNKRGMFFPPEAQDTVYVNFYEGDPSVPELYFGGWYGKVDGTADTPTLLKPPASQYPEKKGFVTRAGHSLIFNDEAGNESVLILWNKPDPSDAAVQDRTQTAAYNKTNSAFLAFDKNGLTVKTANKLVMQLDDLNQAITITKASGSMLSIAANDAVQMVHKSGASIAISDTAVTITANPSQNMNVNVSGQNVNLNAGGVNLGARAADFAVLGLRLIAWLASHTHPFSFGVTLPPVPPPVPPDFLSNSVKVQE